MTDTQSHQDEGSANGVSKLKERTAEQARTVAEGGKQKLVDGAEGVAEALHAGLAVGLSLPSTESESRLVGETVTSCWVRPRPRQKT